MRLVFERLSCLVLLFMPLLCFAQAQENTVRVGVAIMQNRAGRSVPGNVERDRLVRAINQQKPDKKTHLKVQAVPLNASTSDEASAEAEQQKCQYVVYTTLIELRNQQDPYQHLPNTIETNPNSQWNSKNTETQAVDPEFRATVDYRLVKVGSNATVSGAPFSTQQNGNEIDTVSMIMDRIALQVADQVKKGAPPMQEQ
jgi:hypothetical protein